MNLFMSWVGGALCPDKVDVGFHTDTARLSPVWKPATTCKDLAI